MSWFDILDVIRRMQALGIIDSVLRVLGYMSMVFRMAMVIEMADRDPTVAVADALEKRTEKHFAAITEPAKVRQLMRAIYAYDGATMGRLPGCFADGIDGLTD